MADINERVARLEAQQESDSKNFKDIWDAIDGLRKSITDGNIDLRNFIASEVKKVCEKLAACEIRHDKSFVDGMKGAEKNMKTEIEAMKTTVDRVWGVTWKALTLLGAIILLLAGWNVTLMSRMSSSEQTIFEIQTRIEAREDMENELVTIMKDIRHELRKEKEGG